MGEGTAAGAGNSNILGVGHSIPGTTQTISGYDTEVGMDAICWRSQGYVATNVSSLATGGINVSNPLLQNLILDVSGVTLLRSCPMNNALTAYEPIEAMRGERLRTKQLYNYTVVFSLDLSTLHPESSKPYLISDKGSYVSVQVLVCQLGRSGFCSPFIHEAANVRLYAMNSTLPKPGPGESHGGTHVHSKYQYIHLPPNMSSSDQRYTNITVHVPMLINEPGQYFTIAAVQLYLGVDMASIDDDDHTALVRYDMANAIHDMDRRVFTYQSPVTILEIPNSVRIVSYIVIGISGAIIAGMLYFTVVYRNHQVMKLTQGYFLMSFLFAALVATIMSMFLEPRNDLYCQISLPSILISAQFMYAITLGRLWRINTLISPLLMQTLRYKSSWIGRLSDSLQNVIIKCSSSTTSDRVNLKRQINSKQLCIVVWVITAPQIILQALVLLLQTPYLAFEYNSDESIGRAYCHRSDDFGTSIETYGFICFGALVVVLLLVANHTRSLPCLFNETSDIFSSTLTSLCVFVVGGGIVVSTNSPTTSPALQYLLGLALAISVTLNTSVSFYAELSGFAFMELVLILPPPMQIRIVMPKLRLIWSGETVLVSKLVSDHSKNVRRRNFLFNSKAETTETQSGKQSELSESVYNADNINLDHQNAETTSNMDTGMGELEESVSPLRNLETSSEPFHAVDNNSDNNHYKRNAFPPLSFRNFCRTAIAGNQETANAATTSHPTSLISASSVRQQIHSKDGVIYISNSAAPSRRLLLPLVEMQSTLQEVNQRIMSGLGVGESDWMALRQRSVDLGQMFNDQVQFDWESSTFETTALVDVERNVRKKQTTLDTFIESGHEGESDDDDDDDDDSDCITDEKVRIQRDRLEL